MVYPVGIEAVRLDAHPWNRRWERNPADARCRYVVRAVDPRLGGKQVCAQIMAYLRPSRARPQAIDKIVPHLCPGRYDQALLAGHVRPYGFPPPLQKGAPCISTSPGPPLGQGRPHCAQD